MAARGGRTGKPGKARIRTLIEEATVDAYGEEEQAVGFQCMMDDHLKTPFKVMILGVKAEVKKVDITQGGEIVAICTRGKEKLRAPILDLTLPKPEPEGAEWIHAYRAWREGRW